MGYYHGVQATRLNLVQLTAKRSLRHYMCTYLGTSSTNLASSYVRFCETKPEDETGTNEKEEEEKNCKDAAQYLFWSPRRFHIWFRTGYLLRIS